MCNRSRILIQAFTLFLAACNAPLNPEVPVEKTAGPESINYMPLTYQTLKTQILDPRCVKCHCAQANCLADSIPFDSYQAIDGDPQKRWSPPSAQSQVIRALTRADKFRMPPPSDSAALTADEIEFVSNWIDAGKPEF